MWGCGEESNSCQDHSTSATTQDWELKADLGKQLKYSGNNNLNAGHGADFRSLQAGGSHRGGQMRGKVDESLRKWVASDVWTDWGGMQRVCRQDPQQAGLPGDQQAKGHQICHQGNWIGFEVSVDQERRAAGGTLLPGHKSGLDQPQLGLQGEGVWSFKDPKLPMTQWWCVVTRWLMWVCKAVANSWKQYETD